MYLDTCVDGKFYLPDKNKKLQIISVKKALRFCKTGCYPLERITIIRGVQIPGASSPAATKFCTVAPNICGSSVRTLRHEMRMTPKILRFLKVGDGGTDVFFPNDDDNNSNCNSN
jgi:hypothetical protein